MKGGKKVKSKKGEKLKKKDRGSDKEEMNRTWGQRG